MYLDFINVFDKVDHSCFLDKLEQYEMVMLLMDLQLAEQM